jgi:hypothetical protein
MAAARTRSRVFRELPGLLFNTRETVAGETSAACATSRMDATFYSPWFSTACLHPDRPLVISVMKCYLSFMGKNSLLRN